MRTLANLAASIDAVVIGASAGGVEALLAILPALPAAMPLSVFVVLHLPRERPSLVADVFQAKCAATVREAQDKEPIEPGTIYIAPPDYHLLIDVGPQLALSADALVNFSRPSVDVLFESAADAYGARLLGILLTGASEDGAAGLASIHDAGGWAMVQRPDQAQAPVMVEAALRTTTVDFVVSLPEIADVFRTLVRVGAA